MDLTTNYLGMTLRSPLVPSASPLSEDVDNIQRMEDAGAAAVVMHSLFEEQLSHERRELYHHLTHGTESYPEAVTYFPEPASFRVGPEEYLNQISKAKEKVGIPIIASLNGCSVGGWTNFARLIQQAGASALELNIYYVPTDMELTSTEIEQTYIDILCGVKAAVTIPVAVKLSPYFTNMANMAKRLDNAGADALVLFNRFYQPDINLDTLEVQPNIILSTPQAMRLPLRWLAILYGRINANLAATSGIHKGQDVLKITLNMHGLDLRGIDPLLSMGGTILGTINKGDTLARAGEIIASYEALALDALIVIGGDGSLAILQELASLGNWNLVGIPKTIDHDVALTERAIGFDTAVNTIVDALNRLTFTAASHDRVMIVEVMGRKAGHLALHSGIAGGADVILMPEIPYSIVSVCKHLVELRDRWQRKFAIIVVAEGAAIGEYPFIAESSRASICGIGQYIAEQVDNCSAKKIDMRVSVLGHIQRGGIPSALDRLTATIFGKTAVDLVAQGKYGLMLAWQNRQAVAVPIKDVVAKSPLSVDPNSELVQVARSMGIYVGETV